MALTKCKECGAEISTKANKCPKCGAKTPKRTSLVTWLVLLFIVFTTYSWMKSPSPSVVNNKNTSASSGTAGKETAEKASKASESPSWSTLSSIDEMTGESMYFAHSPTVKPTKAMSSPYSNVEAWFGVGCNTQNEWAYIAFNSSPNLANDETQDGYSIVSTRIKWDDKLQNVELTQAWGDRFLRFNDDQYIIRQIIVSSEVLLELQWYGEQPVYFGFTLNEAASAISEIRSQCDDN